MVRPQRGHFRTKGSWRDVDPRSRGLEPVTASLNNRAMKLKSSERYAWDEQHVDDRPSEFSSSTGFSVLSGYHPKNDPFRRSQSRRGRGFKSLLLFCAVVLALGVFALVELSPLLRR